MNRKIVVLVSSVALLLLLGFSVSAAVASDVVVSQELEDEIETSSEPVEVLVTFESPDATTPEGLKKGAASSQERLIEYAESNDGVTVLNTFWITNAVLLEVDPNIGYEPVLQVDEVRSMKPNAEIKLQASVPATSPTQSPTYASTVSPDGVTAQSTYTYGIEQINAPDVWSQYGTKGGGVNVAVLDTGVNASHSDIDLYTTDSSDATYPGGWAEFKSSGEPVEDSEPYDSHGHGTHVSGTVAGAKTGVAPDVNLMHGLVMNGNTGSTGQVLSGVEWAVENDADIISLSLGGETDGVWADMVENTNKAGVLVVSSVGNNGAGNSASPGNVYDVVSVGAVDSDLDVARFSGGEVIDTDSEWGSSALDHWPSEYVVPDIVAAGVEVNSTAADGGYGFLSGTSMAAPHVAGAAALALSATGSAEHDELRNAFIFTTDGSDDVDTRYGHGVADALAFTEFLSDDAAVSGTVVDDSGTPVEDAEVRVNDVPVGTDSGEYEVVLAQGSWSISASASGYHGSTESVSLSQDETAEVDILLEELEPAYFEVDDLDRPSEAGTGETVSVSASVTNTGEEGGTQDVTLRIAEDGEPLDGNAVADTETVNLGSSESASVEFTADAPAAEGEYVYGVFTDDDSAEAGLTVEEKEPAFFEISSFEAPTEAGTGEEFSVTATLTNTGGEQGTQDVTYRRNVAEGNLNDATVVETESGVSLDAGESGTVVFSVTAPAEEGDYRHGVFTGDDTETGSLTVEGMGTDTEPAYFDVSDLNGPSKAEPGEEVAVTATVTNTGGQSGTQDLTLRLAEEGEPLDDEAVVDTNTVSLSPDSTSTVGFTAELPDEEGEYDYGVFTDQSSVTDTFILSDASPPFFDVSDLSGPSETEKGGTVTVTADVTNTGEKEGTQDVTLRLNQTDETLNADSVVETEEITVGSDESASVEFTADAPDAEGDYVYGVFTDDAYATGELTVLPVSEDDSVVDDYRNDEGRVDTAGLQAAISDFLAGDIDTGNLQDLIAAFLEG